jgi:hypothetical protein
MDASIALEDIDSTLTRHFLKGRGWIGFTLVVPKAFVDSILQASKASKLRHLNHIAIKMNSRGRGGKISLNLEGKVIGGGVRRLDVPVKVVDLCDHSMMVKDVDVKNYIEALPVLPVVVGSESEIDPELLELATMRGIDVAGKTRTQILDLIGG